ncbi:hypothetical protein LCGC14_0613880 [marine sediment metagenome]|uniref:Uncharacterized protein n=1 Tax=marine sediment metagenome TaxID=412755 RepID=A0A0F9UFC3_9ZZZZ
MTLDKKTGFKVADAEIYPRLIVAMQARQKCGKTHQSLTAPGDTAFFNVDVGLEGVVHKFADQKIIYQYDVKVPTEKVEATVEWEAFKIAYYESLADSSIRTVVWDTETEMWELIRMARFGKVTQVMPLQYGPVNSEYSKMIKSAYDARTNLILIRKMKNSYINNVMQKEMVPMGYSGVLGLVQVTLELYKDEGMFCMEIVDCRHDPELDGEVLPGPMCDFKQMAVLIVKGTTVEDWE